MYIMYYPLMMYNLGYLAIRAVYRQLPADCLSALGCQFWTKDGYYWI